MRDRNPTNLLAPLSLGLCGLGLCALGASPALAEVVEVHDDHFITKAEAVVDADRKATWLALISPSRWWSNEHTWSADAANLRLTPQAGGCFCETIPETETADGGFTLQGSVEHMRVIQAYPEVALRMKGALGPLQSEPVAGILTIALSEADEGPDGEARTRIVWEYNVGGKMRYPIPVISQAVDGVMTLQLTGLAKELGVVVAPVAPGAESSGEADEAADGAGDGAADGATGDTPDDAGEGSEADSDAPVTIDPEEALEIATEENNTGGSREPADEPQGPSVDEAFGDFGE